MIIQSVTYVPSEDLALRLPLRHRDSPIPIVIRIYKHIGNRSLSITDNALQSLSCHFPPTCAILKTRWNVPQGYASAE